MKLENEFTVPVDIDTVYQALNDPERVTPCFPGATLDSHEGDDFTGTVKVKLGPISMTYKGKGTFVERDATNHKVVVDAQGRDSRGNGTASAKATLTMTDDGGKTKVNVSTEMQVTGKPAQFGRGVMSDVGDKILGQFAACLADEFTDAGSSPAPASSGSTSSSGSSGASGAASRGGAAVESGTDAAPVPGPAAPTPVGAASGAPEAAPLPTTVGQAASTTSTTAPVGSSPAASTPSPADASAAPPRERQRVEEIDLLESSRDAVMGRLTSPPVLAGVGVLALLLVLLAILRRRKE